MSDYWKKKLEELQQSDTSSNQSSNYLQNRVSELEDFNRRKKYYESVAPISAKVRANSFFEEEEDEKWYQGYLQKGSDEGVAKTILGTSSDFMEDLTTGIVGMGETLVDSLAYIAPLFAKGQYYQNGGGYNVEQDKLFEQQFEASKKASGDFIKKDLYDEKKVAQQILSNAYAGSNNVNKLQSGMYLTEADLLEQSRNAQGIMDYMNTEMESDSVLGHKADSLVQSGGQLLATTALSAAGVPWWAVTGTTAFGAEAENALNQNATYEQAGLSATISAGAEVLSEQISGGIKFGGKTLDEALTNRLARTISNKALRMMAKFGMDVVGEGAEEVVSEFMSNLGSSLYKEEDLKEILFNEEALDNYLQSFIGGGILGGFGSTTQTVQAMNKGVDAVTGMTAAEQKVIDKLYKDSIAEAEKKGKVTQSDKAKAYEKLMEKLEKGYLTAEEVESVLGGESYHVFATEKDKFFNGETYKSWQENKKRTEELKKKIEELGGKTNPTLMEQVQFQEMRTEFADRQSKRTEQKKILDAEAERIMGLRNKMRSEVMDKVFTDGSRLTETYRELERKKQKFQTDVNQYTNENARKTVQSILNSGLGDNSHQFHDTVNWLAKISEQKGVTFDLTKTERLKGTEHYKEGYVTNGFKTKNGNLTNITINLDGNYLNTTVGHEITHVLEEAGVYKELQVAVRDYAISKEGLEAYNKRVAAIKEIYGNNQNTIDSELTADIIGEYLFTDSDFVNSLSVDNRNVFQKVYDEIKYLLKVATTGSAEKRELEKVKKIFDKAWRENIQGKPEVDTQEEMEEDVDDVQYSVSVDDKETLDFLNEQIDRGEYDPETNPDGGYYVTYKSMSFWGYDEDGNAILRSPMAEYVDGKLSNAYLMPKDKSKLNWYKSTETIDEKTGMPSGLMVGIKEEGKKSKKYVPASENQDLIAEDWSNLYFNLVKKIPQKNGKMKNSPVPARYNPYEHSSNSMLNDQFKAAWQRDNLVTVKMYVPRSEDNGAFRAKYSKDPTGWSDWKSGDVATKINKQKDLQRRVYLSRYAAPVEIVPDSEVAQAYKEYISGTDVKIPDNVVSPNLLKELKNAGVPIEESGKVQYSVSKDSTGRDLTAEQQEFFKDSKVVDDNGNLKVMYHGTPNGDFTVFKDGTYFTDNKEYADRYQNPGASSISSGKTASNPKTFEVYLDIKKPFDLNDAEARNIYINEYIKGGNAMGINPYLSDAEYAKIKTIDWTEGEDLRDFLIENEYDYDGLVLDEGADGGYGDAVNSRGTSWVVFSPEQVKNVDNAKPTSNPDVRYSMTQAEKAKMDEDYFAAVESGDEEVQKHLVREYAKASMPDSKLVDENGNLREVYHGTNTGDFTVFNPDYIGMSSGDDGFFGMGFYFAYSKGEAAYYGRSRVIPAYLNLTNPFNFDTELQTYNGKKARSGKAPDAVALMNFADKFPEIAKDITIGAIKNGESSGEDISVFEFVRAFKDVIENKKFEYQEIQNEYGETDILVTADPEVHEYEYNGEIHSYRDFGFQKRWYGTPNELDVAYEYLSNAVYSYLDIPRRTNVILDNNREFTAELKNRGYDGTIQSEYGDEAVAFYPNQIKSAKPVTKDADGNIIPLSKRFDSTQDDIRYSMSKVSVLEDTYKYDLENDDLLGAEMVVEQMANLAMPDSKIRDKNGQLIPVYHGTNADFWEFDTTPSGGKNGTAEGFGIYLSDDQEVTNAYGDRQIKMFANITHPATSFKKTIKTPTLVKLIKQTCERQAQQMVDEEGYDNIRDAIRDTWVSNYVDTYSTSMDSAYREVAHSMLQQNDNDKDIIHEVMFGMAIRSYDQAMDFYRNSLTPVTGIDGFVTKWENASTGSSSNIYLAFDSSQLKSADAVTHDDNGNVIPLTERFDFDKKDIRYSISKGERNTSGDWHIDGREFGNHDEFDDFAPVREDIPTQKTKTQQKTQPRVELGEEKSTEEKVEEKTTAQQRREKSAEYTSMWEDLIGDTSTWVDLPTGLAYKTRTLRRILRKVVRDANGKPDIQRADAIYDALETKYDHNEALLKRESAKLKDVFQKLNLNHAEDQYAQMLGELRYNPETTLSEDVVKEYLDKHKGKINEAKVNEAIKESRKLYDDLLVRVNAVLKEQGFKEIPYRKGYFPHFTNPKQNWLQKALNWKPTNDEIPTSIAGLTEMFKPNRSWQSFNKQRMGDKTDYSLYQGLDTYIHGALDWIYHIEDLQQRRSLENLIRYTHSEEGVKQKIQDILKGNYDADEAQSMINAVLDEANNPLGGLVRELMNRTNTLANKKSSMDRAVEDLTSRKVYSVMTNLNNRITANQVVGSLSSAMTNFIPMVQSWHQVSPWYTVRGMGDYIRSVIKDDGMVQKSDFLTNRLMEEEKLYQTGWDKVSDKAAVMMNVVDGITSNTVWRSKYLQNLKEGMSETQAIKDADQFAKNLMAGRSRGNAPTIFDAKNPLVKMFTAFQLEVANQYGYMFDDVVKDSKSKARLVKGYATAFLGAYAYNALYSSLVGRDAAFDPISIIQELLSGLFDDEEEKKDVLMDFGTNILEEVPFVGGMLGGGRIPLSSAFPYSGYSDPIESMLSDISEGKVSKEWLKPLWYLAMPVAGGQIKKTVEGLGMFSDDHPVTGSYTESGNLRFPVEDTFGNKVQAALFGQYASKNARDYFDNNRSALKPDQIQEYMELDAPIQDYWEYRDGLKGLDSIGEKADYIDSLDFPIDKKNMLINNLSDRKTPIDLTNYSKYDDFEEFDWATKNPEKYEFFNELGISYKDYKNADEETKADYNWAYGYPQYFTLSKAISDDPWEYRSYYKDLVAFTADKDKNGKSISGSKKKKVIAYIDSLDIEDGAKFVLLKSQYESVDEYNGEIFEYIKNKENLTFEEKLSILKTLGFRVTDDGHVEWD